jgi:ectoine hydroxylase-related dioxygenase (phytanoyl-CoA dioxygenase family)
LSVSDEVLRNGFAVVPDVIDAYTIAKLITVVTHANFARSSRGDEVYGARNILTVPEIAVLADAPEISALVTSIIGAGWRAVRGIFFDKTPGANWPVAWHQDLSLAVSEKRDVNGWGNWSMKAGIQHVQPPVDILDRMVTLRIQLDDNGTDNGPLRVLPGSHRLGRIKADRIAVLRAEIPEHCCVAPAGSALAMKPLILHASSAAKNPAHRRVIHIEFAPKDLLPSEFRWAFAP